LQPRNPWLNFFESKKLINRGRAAAFKEMLMSLRVGVLSVLFLSASVFATHGGKHVSIDGDWTGGGGWKANDGTKGRWEMTSNVKTDKDSMTVKESTTIHIPGAADKKMDSEWTTTNLKNGFFDVQVKGAKVGTGYCGVKQCHLSWTDTDGSNEETITFHNGKVYRLGSHTLKDRVVAWQGTMAKKGAIRPK
jgi:hypothetical protein